MLNNEFLFTETEPVDEDDINECKRLGLLMASFCRQQNFAFLCANQVGSNSRMLVMQDHEVPGGFHVYANAVVTPASESINGELTMSVTPDLTSNWVDSPNFRGKFEVGMSSRVKVNAFSVSDNDSAEFEAEGLLAYYWQVAGAYLDGLKEEDIQPRDCTTIRRTGPKRSPNDKCNVCGRKLKKCVCS